MVDCLFPFSFSLDPCAGFVFVVVVVVADADAVADDKGEADGGNWYL